MGVRLFLLDIWFVFCDHCLFNNTRPILCDEVGTLAGSDSLLETEEFQSSGPANRIGGACLATGITVIIRSSAERKVVVSGGSRFYAFSHISVQ